MSCRFLIVGWIAACSSVFQWLPSAASAVEPHGFRHFITLPLDHKPPQSRYFRYDDYAVRDVAFAPDGKTLAAVFPGNSVRLFDLSNGRLRFVLKDPNQGCSSVAFPPDESLSAYGGVGAEIYDSSPDRADSFCVQAFPRQAIAFSPDGKKVAVGAYSDKFDLYDTKSGERLARFDPFAGMGGIDTVLYKPHVFSLAFTPDGRLLAVYIDFLDDELPRLHRIQIWDSESAELKAVFDGQFCLFSPDGDMFIYTHEGKLELRSVETLKVLDTFGGAEWLSRLALSPDGMVVAAVANDDMVQLWELTTQKRLGVLKGNGQRINSIKFSPNGKLLAAGCGDGSVEVWKWIPSASDDPMQSSSEFERSEVED